MFRLRFQYRRDQYFKDGVRKIDFVLVRSTDLPPSQHAHDARQEIFESNLVSTPNSSQGKL